MKKAIFTILILLMPFSVLAQRGCCSHHGGVSGCSTSGRQICQDGTLSPSCTCTPASTNQTPTVNYIYGCTDPSAINYNASANKDNGSCIKAILGCTDKNAINYNSFANKDDGSCIKTVLGCTNKNAVNYNSSANKDDGNCEYQKEKKKIKIIKYKTKYVDNNSIFKGTKKVKINGQNGKKEIIYLITTNENGKIIKKEKQSSKIVKKPVDKIIEKGTKETSDVPAIIWLISLIIVFIYSVHNRDARLVINELLNMQNKFIRIILEMAYVLFVLPPMIDFTLIIFQVIKKLINNKEV